MAYQGDGRNHLKVVVGALIVPWESPVSPATQRTDDLLDRNPQGKRRTGTGGLVLPSVGETYSGDPATTHYSLTVICVLCYVASRCVVFYGAIPFPCK
jgi:hypothetical protein